MQNIRLMKVFLMTINVLVRKRLGVVQGDPAVYRK